MNQMKFPQGINLMHGYMIDILTKIKHAKQYDIVYPSVAMVRDKVNDPPVVHYWGIITINIVKKSCIGSAVKINNKLVEVCFHFFVKPSIEKTNSASQSEVIKPA